MPNTNQRTCSIEQPRKFSKKKKKTRTTVTFCFSFLFLKMSQTPEEVKPERQLGTVSFPLARVKRIIKEDKDISLIGSEATFCITYATVST